jgi:uncharacterized membrane-anchored protein
MFPVEKSSLIEIWKSILSGVVGPSAIGGETNARNFFSGINPPFTGYVISGWRIETREATAEVVKLQTSDHSLSSSFKSKYFALQKYRVPTAR